MKFVIPCSARKKKRYWTSENQEVVFVSHPNLCNQSDSPVFFKPDDFVPHNTQTWRQKLLTYNQEGTNPDDLCRAADLYVCKIYRELVNRFGWENIFILSAGWGLVRADFWLPYYDITFSQQSNICNRRNKNDKFNDFNHLTNIGQDEKIVFCGGNSYLPLYYKLTRNLIAKKVIYYISEKLLKEPGYLYVKYNTKRRTNWHYGCAEDFVHGMFDEKLNEEDF